ncbi:MAG: iron complex transport system ATP-binding protein, partial [Pseudomonadota bacterium]|nr:iron complex transport system ATP-binding protein [Pseudomonadota bacterium]
MIPTDAPLLSVQALMVSIGDISVCSDLHFSVRPGERLAILGRNGAGKSTLLSVLAGLRAAHAGDVLLEGACDAALGRRASALIRGWLPQARGDAFASTVLESALTGRHPHLSRWDWESASDVKIVRAA